jgi:hypothetical protein
MGEFKVSLQVRHEAQYGTWDLWNRQVVSPFTGDFCALQLLTRTVERAYDMTNW